MRKITRSTREAKVVAVIIGLFVTGFLSTLWVFHIFLGGLGNSNMSTPATMAYVATYAIFSLVGYRTFLYASLVSYEESFIFFNFVPAMIIGLLWLGLLRFFPLS